MNSTQKAFIDIKRIPLKKQKLFGLLCADQMFKDYSKFCELEKSFTSQVYLDKCREIWQTVKITRSQQWHFDEVIIPDVDNYDHSLSSFACNAALCLRLVCTKSRCAYDCAQYHYANADLKDYEETTARNTSNSLDFIQLAISEVRSASSIPEFVSRDHPFDLLTK